MRKWNVRVSCVDGNGFEQRMVKEIYERAIRRSQSNGPREIAEPTEPSRQPYDLDFTLES